MIFRHCPKCKNSNHIKAKTCNACDTILGAKYRVIVTEKGKRASRVVDSLVMAKEIEGVMKADMLRCEFSIQDHRKKERVTLDSIWCEYLPEIQKKNKAWKDDFRNYNMHIKPAFGDMELSEITYQKVNKFKLSFDDKLNIRGKNFEPATIKHQLVLLRRLFNVAIIKEKFSGTNPVSKVEMPHLDNEVIRYLSDEQFESLQSILDKWPVKQSVSIIRFLMYTGCRRGEAFSLQWNHIDFKKKLMTLVKPKGKKTSMLPLNDAAIEILNNIARTEESPFVFPGKTGERLTDISCWKRIKKVAKLPKEFRLHDLRHHFATTLISNGVDLYTVSKLLTHKDISTTQRYSHVQNSRLQDASNKISDIFDRKQAEN